MPPLTRAPPKKFSQLHGDRAERLPDVFIVPVFSRKLRDVDGLFLDVARRAAVRILGDVEKAALDPRAGRSFGAMALIAVVALVVVVLCANRQSTLVGLEQRSLWMLSLSSLGAGRAHLCISSSSLRHHFRGTYRHLYCRGDRSRPCLQIVQSMIAQWWNLRVYALETRDKLRRRLMP